MKQNMTKAQFLTLFPELSPVFLKGMIEIYGGWGKLKQRVTADRGINLSHFENLEDQTIVKLFSPCMDNMKSYMNNLPVNTLSLLQTQIGYRQHFDRRGLMVRLGYSNFHNIQHIFNDRASYGADVISKVLVTTVSYIMKDMGKRLNGG